MAKVRVGDVNFVSGKIKVHGKGNSVQALNNDRPQPYRPHHRPMQGPRPRNRGPAHNRAIGLIRALAAAYKHRLREIIKVVPSWVAEQILSASEHIGEDRAAVGMSEN